MKTGVIIAAVFVLLVVSGWPANEAAAETLKGRIWAQWAENPDGEVLFGIQYWNTGAPGSGTPGGRTSVATTEVPDGWAGGGAWGFQGGKIIGADLGTAEGREPLASLLAWKSGDYCFVPDVVPEGGRLTTGMANLVIGQVQNR